jgi:hypothetical protein
MIALLRFNNIIAFMPRLEDFNLNPKDRAHMRTKVMLDL